MNSTFRHPDGSRDPDFPHVCRLKAWVPAFAGMTDYFLELYSYTSHRQELIDERCVSPIAPRGEGK